MDAKKTRGKGRGRGRGGKGRGRGKKVTRIISSEDEETPQETIEETPPEEIAIVPQNIAPIESAVVEEKNKENEPQKIDEDMANTELPGVNLAPQHTIDMEADISQLEAPTFTTLSKEPPEAMRHLNWNHQVYLIGEKVLNPMIHCCDQCDKPILVYGRMIKCKHVFCLKCAKTEPFQNCPRCKSPIERIERTGLGTVFMCIHGGSRYGSNGCRRTYLSQRDLQAHINHRHVPPPQPPAPVDKTTTESKDISRKIIESNISTSVQPPQQPRSQSIGQITSPNICKSQSSIDQTRSISNTSSSGTNQISSSCINRSAPSTISASIQETQHSMSKINIQQQQQHSQPPQMQMQHVQAPPPPMAPMVAAFYSTTYQPSYAMGANTYSAPTMQPVMTQNYGTISSVQPPPQPPPPMNPMPMQTNPMQIPPAPWQFSQMQPPHYGQYDPNAQPQPWNPQQQYFR